MRFLACVLLLAAPAGAALTMDSDTRRAALYQRLYDRLPAGLHRTDVHVREVRGLEYRGLYRTGPRLILLRRPDGMTARTFLHEFGHHVHSQMLSAEQWRRWVRFYERHGREENAAEEFAEVFRRVYSGQPTHGARLMRELTGGD